MALIIEDGTIVAGANSYVTLVEIREYALSRGQDMTDVDDAIVESYSFQAMDYLASFEDRYKGVRVSADQMLSWPRAGAWINGFKFANTDIPQAIKNAQCQGCIEVFNGTALLGTQSEWAVRREKVDVIEVEYATGGGTNSSAVMPARPYFPLLEALLAPLFRSGGMFLSATRA